MKAAATYPNPRLWMEQYFQKNVSYFERQAGPARGVDWARPNVMVAAVCLAAIKDVFVCLAAGRSDLAERLLSNAHRLLGEAKVVFGNDEVRDEVDLDRVALSLAGKVGRVMAPGLFADTWSTPFDAFSTYLGDRGRLLEEKNAARVLWALFAVLDGNSAEYERAQAQKLKTHIDLQDEMVLVSLLWKLSESPDHQGWATFERVLARWLNPILTTESYASNFQNYFAFGMSMFWARDRLKRADRDTLLATYLGETLSIPVPVG